ncbi:hypothetical protein KIPB_014166, partial [Kipferlia bialata]
AFDHDMRHSSVERLGQQTGFACLYGALDRVAKIVPRLVVKTNPTVTIPQKVYSGAALTAALVSGTVSDRVATHSALATGGEAHVYTHAPLPALSLSVVAPASSGLAPVLADMLPGSSCHPMRSLSWPTNGDTTAAALAWATSAPVSLPLALAAAETVEVEGSDIGSVGLATAVNNLKGERLAGRAATHTVSMGLRFRGRVYVHTASVKGHVSAKDTQDTEGPMSQGMSVFTPSVTGECAVTKALHSMLAC